ncbi:MAG TPA: HEAT repeat domain-containing protein [Bacteroidales bacterium]|nr:HEAT repeat domain-containing protein [Bacteroidales bacterium]
MDRKRTDIGSFAIGSERMPHENEVFRQEIAKIVRIIADRRSIPALINLLEDNESDIRWIAAESLIKIGRKSIIPLLRSIQAGKVYCIPGNGAWHVLQCLLTRSEKKALHSILLSISRDTDVKPVGTGLA